VSMGSDTSSGKATSKAAEQLQLGVVLNGKKHELIAEPGDCLIDTSLKNDVDAPYSCLEGVCMSCMAKLIEGEVECPEDMHLSDEEKAEGKILTCQTKFAQGCRRVVIDYDDI